MDNIFTKIASHVAAARWRPAARPASLTSSARGCSAPRRNSWPGCKRLEAIAGEPDGVAKLETLLMETIDLFQHRIDAWATGLAYRRLAKRRRAGLKGLAGGYLGHAREAAPASDTGGTDGYLQAPSTDQAVTAAILRSAHLRHGGAFAIGLDSASVRQGLDLLDMLQAGHRPGRSARLSRRAPAARPPAGRR